MRFMILVKADKNSEAGALPDEKLLAEMGKYNEELVKAGILLAAEGLQPSSKGARALRRNERVDRRFLAVASEVEGRGD